MRYTVRCDGHVLGTTELDFYQLAAGQHSGWLHSADAADDLLDAISIGYASIRAWMTQSDTMPDGRLLTTPEFRASRECAAISEAVAARRQHVLTLHREDGSELPTRSIVVQDRFYWDVRMDAEVDLDEEADGETDEAQLLELDAPVEHDWSVGQEWMAERGDAPAEGLMSDAEWNEMLKAQLQKAEVSRYQVHVRLANPDDLPSELAWLSGSSE